MNELIKKVPIPTAGLALGLAALGNLLAPCAFEARMVCGALSLSLVVLLVAKIVLHPGMIREDMRNPIFASVSATFFMTLMQLSSYLGLVSSVLALCLWVAAVVGHLCLMVFFTWRFIRHFKLAQVFPSYFICYVGIIVASLTSPQFGLEPVGVVLFWLGFASYLVLLAVVTARYLKHEIPEAARPLFCIYAAPMSLSLAGYLAVTPEPNVWFVGVVVILAQALFVVALVQVPRYMALKFYPSFAAMTFPFVITATALGQALDVLAGVGFAFAAHPAFQVLVFAETAFAVFMVAFVFVHFMKFFFGAPKQASVEKKAFKAREAQQPHLGASAVVETRG